MSDYDNSNRGSLFKNKDKRPDKQDADYRGNAEPVCGHCGKSTPMWVDSWLNKAKSSGETYMALKFKAKNAQAQPAAPAPAPAAQTEPYNDDIPF